MLKTYQKSLKKNPTPEEQFLWSLLRNRKLAGFKFRRQQIIDRFIVDFVCYQKKLIVELDGGQHIENEKYDERRTRILNQCGFQVLRVWNFEMWGDAEKVLERILGRLEEM